MSVEWLGNRGACNRAPSRASGGKPAERSSHDRVFLLASAGLLAGALASAAGAASLFDRLLDSRNLDIAKDVGTAVTGVNEKDEIAIGRNLAGQTLGAAPLVDDRALQTYVNRVGRWVAAQSERPDLPWRFGVVNTASINAFAAPGGYILITRGLYDVLDNEAQLAGVLGHEVGHVVKRHHIAAMQQGGLLSAGSKAVQAHTAVGRSMVGNLAVPNVAEVFARGLDKGSEYEADKLGVVLAARAGYNPNGLVDVLRKLQARGASDDSLKLLYATHPLPADRLGQLGESRLASLPQGLEPPITRVAASAGPARAGRPSAAPGVKALAAESDAAPASSAPARSSSGSGSAPAMPVDPGQLLRGLFGR